MASWHVLAIALATLGNAADGETVLLDFTSRYCGPCKQILPTVQQLQREGYPVRIVDVQAEPQLAARFGVTSVPCFVMLVNGREVDRMVGADHSAPQRLRQMLQRAGASPQAAASGAVASRGTPARPISGALPAQTSGTPLLENGRSSHDPAAGQNPAAISPQQLQPLIDRLMAASVRIRVTANGQSFDTGSGTVIDFKQGEALILTCGHIFRDSEGKGQITCDFFGPGGERGVPAQLVGYDLRRDVGLIVARPQRPITPAPVAPVGYNPQVNETVINIGCDHGQDATAKVSRITSIDKYMGPPNLQVAGQPEVGRSGGGLFNLKGEVIGVCNAKDPEYNEGLYAALASIHAELDRHDMRQVYDRPGAPLHGLADRKPPEMPSSMPVVPGRRSEIYNGQPSAGLNSDEEAALAAIEAHQTEILFQIRTSSDIADGRRGFVLNDVSPQFLRKLAALKEAQQPQSLTTRKEQPPHMPQQFSSEPDGYYQPAPQGQPPYQDQGAYPTGGYNGQPQADPSAVPPWRRSQMRTAAAPAQAGSTANLRWRPPSN